MIPSKDSKLHLERTQSINGVTTVYRCQMTFSGRNVTLTGRTQVINGASVDAVEEHILRVINYSLLFLKHFLHQFPFQKELMYTYYYLKSF